MQDWGGPIGAVVASRYPDRMKRFIAMNTLFGVDRNVREERLTPWFESIKKMEDEGSLTSVLGNLRYLVGGIMMTVGLHRREVITDIWLRAYAEAFQTAEECKGAIAFPLEGLHVDRIRDTLRGAYPVVSELARAAIPAMMIEGLQDKGIWPHVAMAGFRSFFPHATIHEIPFASHYIQEDAPEIVVPLIEEFCLRT
jgi:cis-3-alkyl-4-acyloxetan-2-one decarboxylase